jgi:hypothetical protein
MEALTHWLRKNDQVQRLRLSVLAAGAMFAGVTVLVVTANASSMRHATAPPPGLSSYGRIAWNFEGLLWRTLGTADGCEQTSPTFTFNWTHAACNLPQSNRIAWQQIFAHHTASMFTLSTSAPPDLGNVAPIRIAGRWVRCGASTVNNWLIITGGGSWFCSTP